MNKNTSLFFYNFSFNGYQDEFLNRLDQLSNGSNFFITLSRRFNPNRFIARTGEWSLPWKNEIIPKFKMPEPDYNFNKSFSEITDNEALKIADRIQQGEKFAVLYSGGIDSLVVLVSLLKNLKKDELNSIAVYCSLHSISENPKFFYEYIHKKIKLLDSNSIKIDQLIALGYTPITADEGDSIFGTMVGLSFYYYFDNLIENLSASTQLLLKQNKEKMIAGEIHFSKFEDLIIKHLSYNNNLEFGKILYEKILLNIKTANAPVFSVHDFFWWLIFNVKYLNCSIRTALFFNDSLNYESAIEKIHNWYNAVDYQLWSMNNNNNGQKIKNSINNYKSASRDYIFDFDKNSWYKNFKLKLESLNMIVNRQNVLNIPISNRPVARIALDNNFNMLSVDDHNVRDFFIEKMTNFKIDWI
jgi:hypothetical protein